MFNPDEYPTLFNDYYMPDIDEMDRYLDELSHGPNWRRKTISRMIDSSLEGTMAEMFLCSQDSDDLF